ncbi:MAG TPA: hypothetical protein VGG19_12255 [Tepidisphaeraceae bacterium]|jgi:hypothetical protein
MKLMPLSHEPRLQSPQLDELERELNHAITELAGKYTTYSSEVGLLQSPAARHMVTAEHIARLPQLKIDGIEILRSEYKLRHRIKTEYVPLLMEARSAARKVSLDTLEHTNRKIKAALIKDGYQESLVGGGPRTSLDELIQRHPDYIAAATDCEQARSLSSHYENTEQNENELRSLGERIDEAIRLMVSNFRL